MSQSLNDALRTIRERVTPQEAGERYGLQFSRDHKKAICPWHDDHDPSLGFYKKSREAKCKCQVCGNGGSCIDLTMQLLGLSEPMEAARRLNEDFRIGADLDQTLTVRKANPDARKPSAAAPKPVPAPVPEKPKEPKREIKWDYDHPTAIYPYTDENGTQIFEVLRLEGTDENGKRDKTFRQRHTKDGKYIWKLPDGADSIIYRLPQVLAAIRDGRPIWIAEGEKDVATLESFGLTATTKAAGAQPWSEGQLNRLSGADVVIVHDCDDAAHQYKGEVYAWELARALTPIAKRVRLVNMFAAWPDVPPKGDITDMAEALGAHAARHRLMKQLYLTPDFDPDGVPFWLPEQTQIAEYYKRIPGYEIKDGCICQSTTDGAKILGEFMCMLKRQVTVDNGAESYVAYDIDGWAYNGRKRLKPVRVPASEFDSMKWVARNWGVDANIAPTQTAQNKLAWTIKKLGQMAAVDVQVYNHTGWRKIAGKWAYLYQDGAIGADGVAVDMDNDILKKYCLDGGDDFDNIKLIDACRASWQLRTVAKKHCTIPVLAVMYLSPLTEFLRSARVPPSFAMFLRGTTGSGKSVLASLGMGHFGDFDVREPPGSFNDTYSATMDRVYVIKDACYWLDDYHPVQSVQERRQMQRMVSQVIRSLGDGASRNRMNGDGTMRVTKPARSVCLMTGEDNPLARDTGGLARMFMVSVEEGDVPFKHTPNESKEREAATDQFLALQELSVQGYLRKAMRGYIQWLLAQADDLPEKLRERFLTFRIAAQKRSSGEHARTADNIAHLLVGYEQMLHFFCAVKLLTPDECGQALAEAMNELLQTGEQQSAELKNDRPAMIFLSTLGDLIQSGAVTLKDMAMSEPDEKKPLHMIGYKDRQYYYFIPKSSYGVVYEYCERTGNIFPGTIEALNQSLKRENVVVTDKAGNPARMKYADGKNNRYYWVRRSLIDGTREEQDEQQQMEFTETQASEPAPF